MDRSRRTNKPKDRLAELKLAREGVPRAKQWKQSEEDLYDEVDEHQYKAIVKGRLQRDDFIEDDDGAGYADNGEDFQDDAFIQEESDSDHKSKKKSKPSKAEKSERIKKVKTKPETSSSTYTANAYRPAVAPEQEADFLSNLLDGMDTTPQPLPTRAPPPRRKRKPSPTFDHSSDNDVFSVTDRPPTKRPMNGKGRSYAPDADDPFSAPQDEWRPESPPRQSKRPKINDTGAVTRKIANLKVEPIADDDDFGDMMDLSDVDMAFIEGVSSSPIAPSPEKKPQPPKPTNAYLPTGAKATAKKEESEDGPPAWLALHSSLLTETLASSEADDALASSGALLPSGATVNALEDDGSLHLFWLDYIEHEGKIFLTGKVLDKGEDGKSKKYVSCCVTIQGLERNLYVLPRDKRFEHGFSTDVTPSKEDVYRDFDALRRTRKIRSWGAKWVKRKYAFGMEGVPEGEAEWMKVVYPFTESQIPMEMSSPNFSHIFGTNTSAFELFVLKRKIMGPCWLKIKNPEVLQQGVSWCKLEAIVKDPKDVNPFPDSDVNAPRDVPPLTVMSLAVRSVVNHQLSQREIVCISSRVWENNKIDDPTPPEKQPSISNTVVRPLGKYPAGFEARAKAEKSKLVAAKTEKALLGQVLSLIQRCDPDVIVGHEFLNLHLDIIMQRLKGLKVEHWSRIGRFRRANAPIIGKQGMNAKFLAGRLICDLTTDGAKGMIASTTWSLTEMCQSQLKQQREDIDPDDTPTYLDGTVSVPDHMLRFVKHCEMDTYFQMAIASKVQVMPLTRQLTNLAGNSWNRTLTGGRSERNEYILLHEFHKLKYICPDKSWGKKDTAAASKAETEEADGEQPSAPKKWKGTKAKDKYKGGLVFEPKRGLWDKYVLVMDFNSLYPSIIQEYNIDFTTVAKVEDEAEDIPEVPAADIPQGVLPRMIATLVNRRKAVKSLMKDRSATPAQLLQYDIKQKAIKLTANSMYGCLGFAYSRFYARPLAALTTHKGREILTHTKELAESMSLDVVYGDTDSVFVNSNVTDLAEALKIANEFKKLVNERYKLLEIDLDGIFQRLLLLQKKKYAALKVEDGGQTSTEIKGLDMKRREFCALSKTISGNVLGKILSGDPTEIVIEGIHEYLTNIGTNVRDGKIPLDDFIIFKRLGRNPEDYPNEGKDQPHVQVALRRKAKGATPHGGDVIPYIICLGDDGSSSKAANAERARHPDEFKRVDSDLKIDFEHYLATQILPPVARLCEEIEGTDRARLAECLGLNPDQYASSTLPASGERQLGTLDSQIPDRERFKDTDNLLIACKACGVGAAFSKDVVTPTGLACPACAAPFHSASLQMQLELQIREHISRYYAGWVSCDEHTCEVKTRSMSVYGRKCSREGCRGVVSFEYPDLKLYNQLLYYASLFDLDKLVASSDGTTKQADVEEGVKFNADALNQLGGTVDRYLNQCGRRWVDLGGLFSFMKV